jgi:hypothetical protein
VALSIVSVKQDQSNQLMPELGEEQVKNINGEKSLEREVQECTPATFANIHPPSQHIWPAIMY